MTDSSGPQMAFDMLANQTPSFVPNLEQLSLTDAEICHYHHLFTPAECVVYLQELQQATPWKQERIKLFGKVVDIPRLTAWYGDAGTTYSYSGITVQPDPWTETITAIKERVEEVAKVTFNSVLLNLYRTGSDSVAWHSDDEPELGLNPIIGSVSFGETRVFRLRHKENRDLRPIPLEDGDFLLMQGPTQHFWEHQIPKTTRPCKPRINLTFRIIT